MNNNPAKDPNTGKFKTPSNNKKYPSKEEIIKRMKEDLIAGSTDLERIKMVYHLIVGNDHPVNVVYMKRTIMNYDLYQTH